MKFNFNIVQNLLENLKVQQLKSNSLFFCFSFFIDFFFLISNFSSCEQEPEEEENQVLNSPIVETGFFFFQEK